MLASFAKLLTVDPSPMCLLCCFLSLASVSSEHFSDGWVTTLGPKSVSLFNLTILFLFGDAVGHSGSHFWGLGITFRMPGGSPWDPKSANITLFALFGDALGASGAHFWSLGALFGWLGDHFGAQKRELI